MGKYDHLDASNAEHLLRDYRLEIPKKVLSDSDWTLEILQEHLQWAVDIELYTIPFYMSAMYSVVDQASEARRLLRSVVNQEMLHMQCAANVANAYGTKLVMRAPSYGGNVPHLDFSLDKADPLEKFSPYSTAIGPLDVERINAMCIIEFPDWDACTVDQPTDSYASIGDFYKSLVRGMDILFECIECNHQQVGHFTALYPQTSLTVTQDGNSGLCEAKNLIALIVDQGEGEAKKKQFVKREYQNRVDDLQPAWDHFEKFSYLREQPLAETYAIGFGTDRSRQLQEMLLENFGEFLVTMCNLFSGKPVPDFAVTMYKLGAGISACWQNGALPVFSKPATTTGEKL